MSIPAEQMDRITLEVKTRLSEIIYKIRTDETGRLKLRAMIEQARDYILATLDKYPVISGSDIRAYIDALGAVVAEEIIRSLSPDMCSTCGALRGHRTWCNMGRVIKGRKENNG